MSKYCWSFQKVGYCVSTILRIRWKYNLHEPRRLHSLGFGIGLRLNELIHLRDKPGKRELKLITVLQASARLKRNCHVSNIGWLSQILRFTHFEFSSSSHMCGRVYLEKILSANCRFAACLCPYLPGCL